MVDCQSTLLITITSSVTRLGDFLNFFVTNFLTKVAQIFWQLYGLFKIMLHVNMIWLLFRRYWENWATFYFIIWSHCLREYQMFDHKFMWRPKFDITIIPKNNLAASSEMPKFVRNVQNICPNRRNFCPKYQKLSKMSKIFVRIVDIFVQNAKIFVQNVENFVRNEKISKYLSETWKFCPNRRIFLSEKVFFELLPKFNILWLAGSKAEKDKFETKNKKVFFSFSTFFGRLLFIFFSLHFFLRILTHFIRGSITVPMPLRILHRDRSYT